MEHEQTADAGPPLSPINEEVRPRYPAMPQPPTAAPDVVPDPPSPRLQSGVGANRDAADTGSGINVLPLVIIMAATLLIAGYVWKRKQTYDAHIQGDPRASARASTTYDVPSNDTNNTPRFENPITPSQLQQSLPSPAIRLQQTNKGVRIIRLHA